MNDGPENDAGAGPQLLTFDRVPLEALAEHQDRTVVAVVRDEHVAALAQYRPLDALLGKDRRGARQVGDRVQLEEERGGAADSIRGVPRHRLTLAHHTAHRLLETDGSVADAHDEPPEPVSAASSRTSSGPTVVTSPAPIVRTEVPRAAARCEERDHVTAVRQVGRLSARVPLKQALEECLAADTWNGGLTSAVHVHERDTVGVGERIAEVLGKRLSARVAVWLEQHHDTLEVEVLRRSERSSDLGGMVGVVVNHGDTVHLTDEIESAANTGESTQRVSRGGDIEPEHPGRGKRSGAVERHVVARYARHSGHTDVVREDDLEARPDSLSADDTATHRALLRETVRDHASAGLLGKLDHAGAVPEDDEGTALIDASS